MIDTQAVKNKILNLAMRGQLTEQIPEDESAEELYAEIIKEKARLVKEGKIKKEKSLGDISDEDAPFDIPANWKWVYFGELFSHNTGKALNASDNEGNLLEYITTSNMYWDHFELDNLKKMYFKDDEIEKCTIKKGDLLICEGGDIGRSAIWNFPYEMRIQNHIHKLRPYLSLLSPVFYYYVMMLYKASNLINGQGIGLQGFSSKRVHMLVVPLPPASEQARIVERIEAIFEILDKIDSLQNQYVSNQEALKSKLIDAAIQGKLTEQLPEDGTTDELYVEILKVKSKLVEEGKIKKDKPLPDIKDEEIPFEIPDNWKWIRFSDLYSLSNGVASRGSDGGKPHPVLRLADLTSGEIDISSIRSIDLADSEFDSHKIQKGDLVFIRVNGSRDKVANAFLYSGEEVISYCDHLFCAHKISDLFEPEYIMLVYYSSMIKKQIDPEIKTTAGQNTINQKSMSKIMIPLPPTAEQRRIVEKVNMLLLSMPE